MVRRRRRRRKSNSKFFIFLFLLAGIAGYLFYQKNVVESGQIADIANVPAKASSEGDVWWDSNYAFRRLVKTTKQTGKLTTIKFNHAALVADGRSLADGSDLKMVGQIGDISDEVGFALKNPNSAETEVTFDPHKYSNANYYLYYGNRKPLLSKVLGTSTTNRELETAELSEPFSPNLSLVSKKYWQLIKEDGLNISLTTALDPQLTLTPDSQLYYAITGRTQLTPISSTLLSTPQLSLDIDGLKPGDHDLYLVLIQNGKYYRSNTIQFMLSYPVYVTWTIDWEGYNVLDTVLTKFTDLSTRYGIPMTQFFNPRIYIDKTVPQYRRDQLTNWVKLRTERYGDEIAMHMHMQFDMVRAAGVEPITSPRWGTGTDGYDTLTSAYNYEQFNKIVTWALDQFAKNNLPVPAGYRAGGWFANSDTLKVLNDKGFVYDSSGRETYEFGKQKKAGSWKLSGKTQPYKPSTTDQNSELPAPNLKLWEVPNNGNDSYWFPTEHLIGRFYENYDTPGQKASEAKLITYLTHPDWFDVDQPKLEALFTEINKYSYTQDKGPVIYTTISEALKAWM